MQTMRDKWTDERLDDLNAKVDRGFERLDAEMRELRAEMRELRGEMQALRAEMNARFDAMNRTMLWFAGALVIAIVASNLAS